MALADLALQPFDLVLLTLCDCGELQDDAFNVAQLFVKPRDAALDAHAAATVMPLVAGNVVAAGV